jgi:PKD repeat protein
MDTLNYFWTIRQLGSSFLTDRRKSPKVKINSAGFYDIGLRVRTGSSQTEWCESSVKDTLEFFNGPEPDFLFPIICENDSFGLINNSSSIDSIVFYKFVFDDTNTVFSENPKFGKILAGVYNSSLVVNTVNGCADSVTKMVEVFKKPAVSFSILNNNSGIPFSIDLDNTTQNGNSFFWKFGNGDSSSQKVPNYTYQDSGTYSLTLISTSNKGCVDSLVQKVFVLSKFIDADLSKIFLSENILGDIEVSFQIVNSGFNTINNLTVGVDLNDDFEFRKSYSTKIYSGRTEGFKMDATFIPDAGKKIDFVCVRILTVNGDQDSILVNNQLCELGFNNEFSIKLYPNPVEEFLNIQYTLPDDGAIQLQIYDAAGRERKNGFSANQEEGYYSMLIDFSMFERGIYFYRFTFNGNEKTGKFIKE